MGLRKQTYNIIIGSSRLPNQQHANLLEGADTGKIGRNGKLVSVALCILSKT